MRPEDGRDSGENWRRLRSGAELTGLAGETGRAVLAQREGTVAERGRAPGRGARLPPDRVSLTRIWLVRRELTRSRAGRAGRTER